MHLPLEIFGVIGKHLINQGSYGTCASLNVTSRAINEETIKTLYEVVVAWASKSQGNRSSHQWILDHFSSSRSEGDLSAQEGILEQRWISFLITKGAKHTKSVVDFSFCWYRIVLKSAPSLYQSSIAIGHFDVFRRR